MSRSERAPAADPLMDELGAARGSDPRVPDFFIVGMPKCGTTALYRMLRRHPGIFMPTMKEPHFFSRTPGEPRREAIPETLEAYLDLFAEAGSAQLKGEGSTSYLLSPNAPRRIAAINPDARIVAILREPAAFVRSLHLQLLESRIEREADLAAALALEAQRRAAGDSGLWSQMRLYSEHLRWREQLGRYQECFGRERLCVLVYDDFRADNYAVTRQVARFLGVDDEVEPRLTEANPTVLRRDTRLAGAAGAMQELASGHGPVGRGARAIARLVPRRARRGALMSLNRRLVAQEAPPPDERTMQELRDRFAPEVAAAAQYLGRDLMGLWGYPPPPETPR